MRQNLTNKDKMLTAVLVNKDLMDFGKYHESDFTSFDQALLSDNLIVRTVARIIQGHSDANSEKSIYNEITDYLKKNV